MASTKIKSKKKVFQIETEYETEVTYLCPIRGQVMDKVIVKRYESPSYVSSFDLDTDVLDKLVEDMMYGSNGTDD